MLITDNVECFQMMRHLATIDPNSRCKVLDNMTMLYMVIITHVLVLTFKAVLMNPY